MEKSSWNKLRKQILLHGCLKVKSIALFVCFYCGQHSRSTFDCTCPLCSCWFCLIQYIPLLRTLSAVVSLLCDCIGEPLQHLTLHTITFGAVEQNSVARDLSPSFLTSNKYQHKGKQWHSCLQTPFLFSQEASLCSCWSQGVISFFLIVTA